MRFHTKAAVWLGFSLVLCLLVACPVTVDPGEGTITVSNNLFSLKLGTSGVFELRIGGQPVQSKVGVEDLFSSKTPADAPETAVFALDPNEVSVVPLGASKLQSTSQVITGSADLNVYVGPSTTAEPCDDGLFSGTFHLTFGD